MVRQEAASPMQIFRMGFSGQICGLSLRTAHLASFFSVICMEGFNVVWANSGGLCAMCVI